MSDFFKALFGGILFGLMLFVVTILAMPIMVLNAFSVQYIWENLLVSQIGPAWPLSKIVALGYIISIMRYKIGTPNNMKWWDKFGTAMFNSIVMLVVSICLVFVVKHFFPWFGIN